MNSQAQNRDTVLSRKPKQRQTLHITNSLKLLSHPEKKNQNLGEKIIRFFKETITSSSKRGNMGKRKKKDNIIKSYTVAG